MAGKLFIVSGASGTGKTSLLRSVLYGLKSFDTSTSHTTRPPRDNEINGMDYYFVSPEKFEEMIEGGHFLEYAKVFRHYYGTSRDEVKQKMAAGNSVVLEIDWQGAQQVKRNIPDAFAIFILPPSIAELKTRLEKRCLDSPGDIAYRLGMACEEIRHHKEFDALVVNDDFGGACATLKRLLLNEIIDPSESASAQKTLQILL